jgi:hypothetical protein
MQVAQDAAAEVPPPDPILEGGSSPDERQASFLELALCLAGGLPDAALDPLFAVSLRWAASLWLYVWRMYWFCVCTSCAWLGGCLMQHWTHCPR